MMILICFLLAGSACSKKQEASSSGNGKDSASHALPPAADLSTLDPELRKIILDTQSRLQSNLVSAEAWGRLGQAYQAAEFRPQAIECYLRATRLEPSSGKWLYLLALLQLQDNPQLAWTNMSTAVALLPGTNEAPRLVLGKSLAERGQSSEAARHFLQILSTSPYHPAARLELARLQFKSNNLPSAIDMLRPSVTNPYTAKPAMLLLSQLKARAGQMEEAAVLAQRSASMPKPFDWPDPYLREVQNFRADDQSLQDRVHGLMMQGRLAEAENTLNQLLRRNAANPETILLFGRLRLQQRKCEEAEGYFRQLLNLQTNSVQGWVQLGLAYFCQSKWDLAAASFQKGVDIKPDFAQAHYNLGLAFSRSRRSADAIKAFQNALRAQPGDPATHAALAEEYLQLGRFMDSEREAVEALRIDSAQPKALRVKQMLEQRAR